MIELNSVATYDGSFIKRDDPRANKAGNGEEFNMLLDGTASEGSKRKAPVEKTETDQREDIVESNVEVVTYTLRGHAQSSGFANGFYVNELI